MNDSYVTVQGWDGHGAFEPVQSWTLIRRPGAVPRGGACGQALLLILMSLPHTSLPLSKSTNLPPAM